MTSILDHVPAFAREVVASAAAPVAVISQIVVIVPIAANVPIAVVSPMAEVVVLPAGALVRIAVDRSPQAQVIKEPLPLRDQAPRPPLALRRTRKRNGRPINEYRGRHYRAMKPPLETNRGAVFYSVCVDKAYR